MSHSGWFPCRLKGKPHPSVAILIDEVNYLTEDELRGLIVALHRVVPQLAALAGDAKSYAERLFDFPAVAALPADAAGQAIQEPIEAEG